MATTSWPQGGQPVANGGARRNLNPPPVCFNCDLEGHFVVDCPRPSRLNTSSFPVPTVQQQHPAGPIPPPYQNGPPQAQYPPQHQPPPQQPPYSYNQPPQQPYYNAPAPVGQYGQPAYQQPPQHYPTPQDPSQYGVPNYQPPPQQYGPPSNAPYQPPPNNYPPQNNGGYGGGHGVAPAPPQNQQWTQPPPPFSRNAPQQQFQQQRRSMSHGQNNYSGQNKEVSRTPSKHSHQPAPRQDHVVEVPQPRPQSQNSNHTSHHAPPQRTQESPAVASNASKLSSRASTPYGRRESTAGLQTGIKTEPTSPGAGELQSVNPGSESPDLENEDQQFNWNFKYIFKEPTETKSVLLAQPLSIDIKATPVPQVDASSTRSISRYARNENQKEFIRSIRSAPQWSYLQEDPAFTDDLDGPLILIEDLLAWIEQRHGLVPQGESPIESRKRAFSEEQRDDERQSALETDGEEAESNPRKRQKNEKSEDLDECMQDLKDDGANSTRPGTPRGRRGGTPCLANISDDDAWAPQPGEGAAALAAQQDPTEALLASLGVEGSPKPVDDVDGPLPPYVVPPEYRVESKMQNSSKPQKVNTTSDHSGHQSESGQAQTHSNQYSNSQAEQRNGPQNATPPQVQPSIPQNNQYNNGLQHGLPAYSPTNNGNPGKSQQNNHHGPPMNTSYNNNNAPPHPNTQQSNYPHSNYPPSNHPQGGHQHVNHSQPNYPQQNNPQGNNQHGANRSASWSGGPPANAHFGPAAQTNASQYGPLVNQHYQNGIPAAPTPVGNANYGPPRSASYPNPQYGPQYNTNVPTPNVPYNGPQQYGSNPPINAPQYNGQYNGPPQNGQYNTMPQYPSGPVQNGQYQYANGPSHSGPPQHTPHNNGYNNGPPQNGNYNQNLQYNHNAPQSAPYGPPQQTNPQHTNPQYPNGQFNNAQYNNGPQQGPPQHQVGPQPQYNPIQAAPQYSGDTNGPQQYSNHPQGNAQFSGGHPSQQVGNVPPRQDSGYESARGSYSNSPGQPFSQDRLEPRSGIDNGGKDANHQEKQTAQQDGSATTPDGMVRRDSFSSDPGTPLSPTSAEILDETTRRSKRPQPVVAEAYSRRW